MRRHLPASHQLQLVTVCWLCSQATFDRDRSSRIIRQVTKSTGLLQLVAPSGSTRSKWLPDTAASASAFSAGFPPTQHSIETGPTSATIRSLMIHTLLRLSMELDAAEKVAQRNYLASHTVCEVLRGACGRKVAGLLKEQSVTTALGPYPSFSQTSQHSPADHFQERSSLLLCPWRSCL